MSKNLITAWVSVNDKLPEPHEKVLIQYGDENVHVGILDSNNKWAIYWRDGVNEQDYDRPITHWQPLPEAISLSVGSN